MIWDEQVLIDEKKSEITELKKQLEAATEEAKKTVKQYERLGT